MRVSERRWLILPIETKARELHAKVLLALFAAERGWAAIVGGKPATRGMRGTLPKGTFIEKSIPPGRTSSIRDLKRVGHRVSAWCEEGLIYLSREDYQTRRLDKESFGELDYFFTWGQNQADDVADAMDSNEKIINSGNPRFDLLRPEFRGIFEFAAERLRKKHGKILLINTFFRYINSGMEAHGDYVEALKKLGMIYDDTNQHMWERMIKVQKEMFPRFKAVLKTLSKEFPEYTIVVRPHPSEKDSPWIEAAAGLTNVKVIYEGSANDWIMASELLIQNNCTTGVEAFLLGKPTISYRPYKDDEVEFRLPNKLGFEATSDAELVRMIREILSGKLTKPSDFEAQRAFAKHYIANVDGPLACETVMKTLEQLDIAPVEGRFNATIDVLKRSVRRVRSFLRPRSAYEKKKFPGISRKEIEDIIAGFQRVSGRFSGVIAKQIEVDGFCVYKP